MKIIKYIIFLAVILSSCAPTEKFLLRQKYKNSVRNSYVRVLLEKTDHNISISAKSKIKIVNKNTGKILYENSGVKLSFYPQKITDTIVISSNDNELYYNDKPFRGVLELQNVLNKIYVINVLDIDSYLYGVVPEEIHANWNKEALKAQAVAARTYAYYHIIQNKNKTKYDLDATTKFQVYNGKSAENEYTNKAVDETSGIIITNDHEPIISYFHSTCGGHTIDDKFVWKQKDFKYLQGVRCSFCKESPRYNWEVEISLEEIRFGLKKEHKRIGRINSISFKKKNGRVISVVIYHANGVLKISGNDFRMILPENKIQSMYFASKKVRDGLLLKGRGWGHGVGLCQWGARGLAETGATYRRILRYYYKNISFDRIKYMNRRYIASRKNKKIFTASN